MNTSSYYVYSHSIRLCMLDSVSIYKYPYIYSNPFSPPLYSYLPRCTVRSKTRRKRSSGSCTSTKGTPAILHNSSLSHRHTTLIYYYSSYAHISTHMHTHTHTHTHTNILLSTHQGSPLSCLWCSDKRERREWDYFSSFPIVHAALQAKNP